jgi:DNA (cytosine-5)-methyltransferase 3A
MKVLSLFDGISCFRHALGNRLNLEYLASEIDKNAIKVSTKNYPTITRLGDVKDISGVMGIDILVGGSPCTDLSVAKANRQGLEGSRSKLFWEFVRIWMETKPKWFILENVASMSEKDKDIITATLGVEPVMINASLVSAQNRKRLFWTNIPIRGLPADRGIMLKDVLQKEADVDKTCYMKGKFTKNENETSHQVGHIGNTNGQANRVYDVNAKSITLTANGGGSGAKTGLYQTFYVELGRLVRGIRRLTPIECERLTGLPDDYTAGVSKTARYKALGNAFHVEIMKWIVSFIPST